MVQPLTAILLGAGERGMFPYGQYALKNPDELKFLAVAEPIDRRRNKFARLHNIPSENRYVTWEDVLSKEKFADIVFICTQDQMHTGPALQALDKGYDILLEKPMAHTLRDCIRIVKKVEEKGAILGVGHVLRYAPFFAKVYEIVQSGAMGELVNITHRENVSWYHMSHSFVRGNWRKEESSSPMILAKCCHDLDLIYSIVNDLPKKISSYGNLMHFKKENMPEGAPKYCVEGCPAQDSCLYYAPRIYIDGEHIWQVAHKGERRLYKAFANLRKFHLRTMTILCKIIPPLKRLRYIRDWPVDILYQNQPEDYSDEFKMELLKSSPYGRCVYQCDNDVVDHQIVSIEFESGVLANLTMHGFSENEGRTLRIDGTKATLIGNFHASGEEIILFDHYSGEKATVYKQKLSLGAIGHGGGDFILIRGFLKSVRNREALSLTGARASLESHIMAFAAEESRKNNKVIIMSEYRKKAESL
ncbi:MAG: Gfo/Idh/MocA family protein [Promethearchaeota archaeon]